MYFEDANNISLWYEKIGSGPPLVMLHGLGSSGSDWVFQISQFQANYEVITIDLRGHGRSSKPNGPYDVATLAKDVAHLLSWLKIDSAHIVGLSLGSFVAMQLACDFPRLVRTLTLAGTTSRVKDIGRWPLLFRKLLLYCCPMQMVARLIAYSLFPEQKAIREACRQRIASNDKRVYSHLFREVIDFDIKERLREISCPVLIAVGTNDTLTSKWHAEEILKRIKQAEIVLIVGARHASPLDAPEKFNALLQNFLLEKGVYEFNRTQ